MSKPREDSVLKQLDDWLFGFGSTTTLGLFRILMGFLVGVNLVMIGTQWKTWFSERGYVPAWLGEAYFPTRLPFYSKEGVLPRLDLIGGITDPRITIPFYIIVTIAAFMTMMGLWTRVSAIVLAAGLVSLHHRNGIILHGGDTVMRMAVLYLAIAPCGAACSVDRLIRVWRGKEDSQPVEKCLWVQRVMCYEVAIVYFTTMWLKYWGSHWRDGTATWYTAHLPEFYRFPVPQFMREPPMTVLTTYGTLLVEFALGTIVFFRPARKWVLLSGVLLHAYIDWSMNIPLFAFLMVACYINFYDGEEVSGFVELLGKRLANWRWTLQVPAGYQLTERAKTLLHVADPMRLATISQSGTSLAAVGADGTSIPLTKALVRGNPALLPFLIQKSVQEFLSNAIEPISPAPSSVKQKR